MKKRTKRYRVQRSAPQDALVPGKSLTGTAALRRGERPRFANVTLGGDPPRPRQTPSRDRHVGSSRTSLRAASERGLAKAAMVRPLGSFPVPSASGPPAVAVAHARRHPPSLVPARMRETAAIATDRRVPRRVEETAIISPRTRFPRTLDGVLSRHLLPASLTARLPPTRSARISPARHVPPAVRLFFFFHPPLSTDLSRSPSRRATSAWPSGWSSPRVYRRPSGARSCFAPATPTRRSSRARSA